MSKTLRNQIKKIFDKHKFSKALEITLSQVEKDVLGLVEAREQKLQDAYGELLAEIEDQKYNLAPPDSDVDLLIVDYDDLMEAILNFRDKLTKETEKRRQK